MVVSAALLLSLVLAPVANAGFKSGTYSGTTSQGEPIAFKAKRLAVKDFSFRVLVDCEDGSTVAIRNSDAKSAVNEKGKFRAVFTGVDNTSIIKGKLKRRQAEGRIEGEATAPNGAHCSGSGYWSAKKQ